MIFYLHGFDATSPGNHEKMRQLQFIDPDVRLISYSTLHPKHDMQHLLKEVAKQMQYSDDPTPLMVGVGLGAYWAERIGKRCAFCLVLMKCSTVKQRPVNSVVFTLSNGMKLNPINSPN